jgi:2-alkenal reductase
MKSKTKLMTILLIIPLLIMACSLTLPSASQLENSTNNATVEATQAPKTTEKPAEISVPESITNQEAVLEQLYQNVNPSVVNIYIYGKQNDILMPIGAGSGFVYDSKGHILTNAHVVNDSDEIEVIFSDGTREIGQAIGIDYHSDLAIIELDELPDGVQPLKLGNIDNVKVGQSVVAIGDPFGLGGTMTTGIVSALGRTIPALTPFSIPESIQTDAAINPGNSGGPLLNLNGEVIGVNAQIETGGMSRSNSGVGFAIPISIVKMVVPELIEKGNYSWSWLGVRGGNVTPWLVQAMELPVDSGAYMAEIDSTGPAHRAGLKGSTGEKIVDGHKVEVGGDVIIAIDGEPVNSFTDLLVYIAMKTKPNQKIELTIIRDGKEKEITVTLAERPTSLNNAPTFSTP